LSIHRMRAENCPEKGKGKEYENETSRPTVQKETRKKKRAGRTFGNWSGTGKSNPRGERKGKGRGGKDPSSLATKGKGNTGEKKQKNFVTPRIGVTAPGH